LLVLVLTSLVLAACGPAATAVPPTQPPAAAPTQAPKVELSVWHSYHTGGSEEQALTQLVEGYKKANPNVTVNVQNIPFDQIFNKWKTDAASGGAAADMFTAPNDDLGNWVRAGLVMPLDDLLKGKLDKVSKAGVDGMTVDGKIYGVPGIIKAVALYYNKDKVKDPPKTTDDLLKAAKGGSKLGIIVGGAAAYFNYGWYSAFGGKLMDDTGKCVADQGGFAEAMQYLVDLKAAGTTFETDGGKIATAFRGGQLDMVVDGPWMLGDYKKDLGDKLGVVPMPAGPKGPAQPLSGIDGWYINPNSKNAKAAVDFALYIFSADGLKAYADVAGDPPARTDVTVADPLIKAFADAAAGGFPRPQSQEFGNYWGPFGDMYTKVLEGKATPADAVKQACADMNKANKK
jgi:arabinogalactan oligomer/maltooligosaccharide transport system substrate-binding protein